MLRAWLRNRPVEVLDEPTAFLDAESAQRVREIIAERAAERLVLVSTHDPALIQQANMVLKLEVDDRQLAEQLHHASSSAQDQGRITAVGRPHPWASA